MSELAPHSEAQGSVTEVKHGVVHRNNMPLLGEASMGGISRLKCAMKTVAPVAVMSQTVPIEESAESIVVVEPRAMSRPTGRRAWRTRIR